MTVIPHLCGFCDDTISDLGTCATCFTWEMVKCEERVTIRINRPSLSTFDRNFFVSLEQKPVSHSGTSSSSLTGINQVKSFQIWQVLSASAVGTMIEWYDFYIFGSLAAVISPLFYPRGNNTFALIAYLSTFAVGFVVRPFGALFFGRIGDLIGRKYAFLITLLI